MTKKHLTDQRFEELNLIDPLKSGIADAGFEFCTPIQEKSLPIALAGKDVAGQAQTGTGKTVAFLLACCQYLISNPASPERKPTNTRALILAPTRELAIQIYNDAEVLARHTELKLGLVYGGTGYDEQKRMLADGADILIGTPGRLIDFFKQQLFDLSHAQVVVLDEADRMFDLGFIKDIRFLLRRMPKPENRLNMLFSATLSFRVMELAYEHMNNPQEVKIDADTRVADKISQYSYYPADEEKSTLLVNLLHRNNPERVLVFTNTRHSVDEISRTLTANSISNAALSGDVPQRKRESLLEGFKSGKYKVLVATDVAARGLHIPSVSHVFNYDLPQDADDYVHRIGRTARAGQSGEAISFICEKYAYSIMEIETYIGHTIDKREIDPGLLVPIEIAARQHRSKSASKGKTTRKSTNRKVNSRPASDSIKTSPGNPSQPVATQSEIEQKPVLEATNSGQEGVISLANEESVSTQSVQEERPAPVADQTETDEKHVAIPMPDIQPVEDTIPAAEAAKKEKISPRIITDSHPVPSLPKPRFSRRFGEIPLVG
jgi:ATP-dependent RNA helicase RhlB